MANIQTYLNNIKNALFGRDVRGSIHDGIDAINKEVENTTSRQVDLENTFDQLVINAGNTNAEIVDARVKSDGTSYSKLGDRLNEVDSQLAQKANKNEVRTKNVSIELGDLSTSVKQAMTGGSVAIIDVDMVGLENLNNQMKYNLANFNQLDVEIQNGFRDTYDGTFRAHSEFYCTYINVNVGERYNCDIIKRSSDTSLSIVNFYDENGNLASYLGKNENGTIENYEFSIPSDVYYMSITSRVSAPIIRKLEALNINSINENTLENIENIKTLKISSSKLEQQLEGYHPLNIEVQDGYRDASSGEFVEHSNYKCIFTEVESGEKYSCDTVIGDSAVAIVNFYAMSTNGTEIFHSSLGKGQAGTYENYEFIIPDDIKFISITSKNTTPILRKYGANYDLISESFNDIKNIVYDLEELKTLNHNYNMYISKNSSNSISLIFKYNNEYDVMFRLYPHGPNKLPQLGTFLKRANSNKLIPSLNGFNEELCEIYTDMIGPYRGLNATSNIDGDSTNHDVWVGGYHGYNGSTSTDIPVANNIGFDLYVDNIAITDETTDIIGVNKCVKLVVTNQIQGCNTMKADGTGRYILEEKVTYEFDKIGEINVHVEIKALEDLSINYYYGLQGTLNYYNDVLKFLNDSNIKTPILNFDFSTNLNAGNKTDSDCYKFIASKGNDYFSMELDSNYGLGRLRYNQSDRILNVISSKKVYFNQITSKIDLVKNQVLAWRGKYRFYSEV